TVIGSSNGFRTCTCGDPELITQPDSCLRLDDTFQAGSAFDWQPSSLSCFLKTSSMLVTTPRATCLATLVNTTAAQTSGARTQPTSVHDRLTMDRCGAVAVAVLAPG